MPHSINPFTGIPQITPSSTGSSVSKYRALQNLPSNKDRIRVGRGVNSAGAEFADAAATLPGTYDTDYSYDSQTSIDFLAARGHKLIRVPFRWERIQPTRNAELDATELARLIAIVDYIQDAGMYAILDVHNYARYIENISVGGAELVLNTDLAISDLVDLWERLSVAFKGNPGVYAYGLMNEPHDLASVAGTFSGTVRYDFAAGSVQGWTGDAATATNVSNKLRLSYAVGSGYSNMRKDDGGTVRGGVLTGSYLTAKFTWISGPTATWTVKIQWQNGSFSYINPTSTTYVRTDTNAVVSSLVSGVEVQVTAYFAAGMTGINAFAVQIEANDSSVGTLVVDMDDFSQGTLTGAMTGAEVWESASQQVVDAIRDAGDDTLLSVAGYGYSGAQSWLDNHPDAWITDPLNNFIYEAHYYFDSNNAGIYPNSYATENTNAVSSGFSNLAHRVRTQLSIYLDWLVNNNVRGFIGETGWPNTGDTQNWNAMGEIIYNLLDVRKVPVTYWATGERWGTSYILSAYTGDPLDTNKTQVPIIEAYPTEYLDQALVFPEIKDYRATTVSGLLTENDWIVNCPSGSFTLYLPPASGIRGREYIIKNRGVGTITIDANSVEKIDGSLTKTVAANGCVTVVSDGGNWIITSEV